MFNIQSEKEMIQRAEAERKKQIYEDRVKRARVAQAKAVEVLKAQNRSMIKKHLVLDNEYKDVAIEMARDYQVSTSVIIRVACEYFHGLLDLAEAVELGKNPRFGKLTKGDKWRPVIWVQKDLSDQIKDDAIETGMSQSRFVRAALEVMYADYLESYKEDSVTVPEFEKTMSDLIWEDMHSYEN